MLASVVRATCWRLAPSGRAALQPLFVAIRGSQATLTQSSAGLAKDHQEHSAREDAAAGAERTPSEAMPQRAQAASAAALRALRVPDRGVLSLEGKDAQSFLQELTTNDVESIHGTGGIQYTMFLTEAGTVLGEAFLYSLDDTTHFMLDCDSRVLPQLEAHFDNFRKKNFQVEMFNVSDAFDAFCVVNGYGEGTDSTAGGRDPRLTEPVEICHASDLPIGENLDTLERHLVSTKSSPELGFSEREIDAHSYLGLRLRLGLSEGAVDHHPTNALPLQCNLDYLNGLSLSKESFLGRERTLHDLKSHNVPRRILPITVDEDPNCPHLENASVVDEETGETIGTVLSHDPEGSHALALIPIYSVKKTLRVHPVQQPTKSMALRVHRPPFMPKEAVDLD